MLAAPLGDDEYFANVLYFADPGTGFVRPGPIARWQAWWELTAARLATRSAVEELAARQGFVVTTGQAERLGISRSRRRTLVRAGRWISPHPGFVSPVDIRSSDPRLTARRIAALAAAAAALSNEAHIVSGRSGAAVHGLATFRAPESPMVTAGRSYALGRRGAIHTRGARLPDAELTSWFGVPITTMARTIVDLARHDRWDAIIAADAALGERLVASDDLARALTTATGWPGVRRARSVLALARSESESPFESLLRLRLHDDGFPAPELQVELAVPGREIPYRVDMLFRRQRLVLEADGLGKYTADELRREKRRDVSLGRLGLRVERVLWDDVVAGWPRTSRRLRALLDG